jgi:hypothetical protein
MSGQILAGSLGRARDYSGHHELSIKPGYRPDLSELEGFTLDGLTSESFNSKLRYISLHKCDNLIGLLGYSNGNCETGHSYWMGLIEIKPNERNNHYGSLLLKNFFEHAAKNEIPSVSSEIMKVSYPKISSSLNRFKEEGLIREYDTNDPFGDYCFSDRVPVDIRLI